MLHPIRIKVAPGKTRRHFYFRTRAGAATIIVCTVAETPNVRSVRRSNKAVGFLPVAPNSAQVFLPIDIGLQFIMSIITPFTSTVMNVRSTPKYQIKLLRYQFQTG